MQNWWQGLLQVFLKGSCPLCDRPCDEMLCPACEKQLQRCRHLRPYRRVQEDLVLLRWGLYGGVLKRAIATMKYEDHPEIATLLGQWLGQLWEKSPQPLPKMIVIPLPMNPKKRQKRGFDQAELIARSFCQWTGLPLKTQGLTRTKETQALFELNPQERKEMLQNAFSIGKDFQKCPPKAPVLLVDDIYTTGATVKEAIQTLQTQNIQVGGVAVAATPQRKQPPRNKN